MHAVGLQQHAALGGHASLGQALVASRRPGEAALRIVPRDRRQGVGIEVIGVLVGQMTRSARTSSAAIGESESRLKPCNRSTASER